MNYNDGQNIHTPPHPEPHFEPRDNPPPEHKKGPLSGLLDGIFPDMKLDDDKIIIVILLIILAREGADVKLLLALGYLLM